MNKVLQLKANGKISGGVGGSSFPGEPMSLLGFRLQDYPGMIRENVSRQLSLPSPVPTHLDPE